MSKINDDRFCPVCFADDARLVTLSCDHLICMACANKSNEAGLQSCPLCREPHLLDTTELRERAAEYRANYAQWRAGEKKGAAGEPQAITRPESKMNSLGLHSSSAGDLAVLGEAMTPPTTKAEKSEGGVSKKLDATAAQVLPKRALGFAIVGMGRAGKIHLNVLTAAGADASVRWLVDVQPELSPRAPGVKLTSELHDALSDAGVDCVIVSTPTPAHAPVIRAALEAGKHVFAEKPLCAGDAAEVRELFELAESRGLLLHTAYNRRHDPAIQEAKKQIEDGANGRPLGATLVSRDFPYPLPSYLVVSGNIFKDCVVHDLDYLTWLLDDAVESLRATAATGDDPQAVARACGMWEYSEVHLTLRSGLTATLVNGRISDTYEHRLDVYCEHGVVRVAHPYEGKPGKAFSDRFAQSYHHQLAAFRDGVRAVIDDGAPPTPNVGLERTLLLEELIHACERSVALGGVSVAFDADGRMCGADEAEAAAEAAASNSSRSSSPRSVEKIEAEKAAGEKAEGEKANSRNESAAAALRTYNDTTAERVKLAYHKMRRLQSVEHVRHMRAKYCAPEGFGRSVRMSVWEAMAQLEEFVDVSDPDVTLPNVVHAFQTAEGLRAQGLPDWLQLTGLIHDLGKMIYMRGCDADGTSVAEQWSIVGDTWVVGCSLPDDLVFPEFNAENPDAAVVERTTPTGIYTAGCGLDNTLCAFGHDEYLYQVLRHNEGVRLPRQALYIIRYHSLYPWHDKGRYTALESEYDRDMKGWVKLFNQHDLYTKRNVRYSPDEMREMREYYSTLIAKYLPPVISW